MVHPGTLFYRRQRGTPTHSFEHRSQIRAQLGSVGSAQFLQRVPDAGGGDIRCIWSVLLIIQLSDSYLLKLD